jgi:hypothetical protein
MRRSRGWRSPMRRIRCLGTADRRRRLHASSRSHAARPAKAASRFRPIRGWTSGLRRRVDPRGRSARHRAAKPPSDVRLDEPLPPPTRPLTPTYTRSQERWDRNPCSFRQPERMSDFDDRGPDLFFNGRYCPFELQLCGLVGNQGLLVGTLVWLQQAPDSFF